MNDWSDGWPHLPSRNWDDIYWGDKMAPPPDEDATWADWYGWYEASPVRDLTLVTVSSKLYGMARAEVIEFTDDFFGQDDSGPSTSIQHVWWNANTQRMTVQFTPKATGPGGIYSYDGVSRELFREFRDAESLGQFFRLTFRRPAPEPAWPGARHDEDRVSFRKIDTELRYQPIIDLDILKAVRLTTGKGEVYKVHFKFASEGDMPVRAESQEEAIEMFEQWMGEHGYTAEVTHVTTAVKRKK